MTQLKHSSPFQNHPLHYWHPLKDQLVKKKDLCPPAINQGSDSLWRVVDEWSTALSTPRAISLVQSVTDPWLREHTKSSATARGPPYFFLRGFWYFYCLVMKTTDQLLFYHEMELALKTGPQKDGLVWRKEEARLKLRFSRGYLVSGSVGPWYVEKRVIWLPFVNGLVRTIDDASME